MDEWKKNMDYFGGKGDPNPKAESDPATSQQVARTEDHPPSIWDSTTYNTAREDSEGSEKGDAEPHLANTGADIAGQNETTKPHPEEKTYLGLNPTAETTAENNHQSAEHKPKEAVEGEAEAQRQQTTPTYADPQGAQQHQGQPAPAMPGSPPMYAQPAPLWGQNQSGIPQYTPSWPGYPQYGAINGTPQSGMPVYQINANGYQQQAAVWSNMPAGSVYPSPYPPMAAVPAQYGYAQGSGMPPKKKASLGLKVFLWIVGILAIGTVLASTVYFTGIAMEGGGKSHYEDAPLPPGGQDGLPDFTEEPVEQPEFEQPDIEVIPNESGIAIQSHQGGEELEASEVYSKVAPSTVTVIASYDGLFDENNVSTGTGIIATSDGYIITNSHVVGDSKSMAVRISTYDENEYDAIVVGVDRTTDLAVLKTNDYGFIPAEFGDASELVIGEWVIAIGNPGGARFSSSMTRGIVSGLNRTVGEYSEKGMTYIQTDAAINPGNSGGPLVNMYGQVIGINSSKIITTGYEGMGFAIPVSKAEGLINELLSEGYISGRVRMGIKGQDVSDMQNSMYNIPYGFMIAEIDEDSPLFDTKAQSGDVIVKIDDHEVYGISSISTVLLEYQPGDEVTLTIYSTTDNEEYEVRIVLLEDKGETQK